MTARERTFLFVICVNDESLYGKCRQHIDRLLVPEGFQVHTLTIKQAASMTSAYNQAAAYPAKYKIYMHQDTFVVERRLLFHLLALFAGDPALGMVGMTGSLDLPENGIWWESERLVGQVVEYRKESYRLLKFPLGHEPGTSALPVKAIDGLFMATQYDVPWREDLFRGFHFYDVSQSIEFQLAGYTVAIPYQEAPWCVHYCGDEFNAPAYEGDRKIFTAFYSRTVLSG